MGLKSPRNVDQAFTLVYHPTKIPPPRRTKEINWNENSLSKYPKPNLHPLDHFPDIKTSQESPTINLHPQKMDTFNQGIQQIFSSLAIGFAMILVFVFVRRIINYVRSLPQSHPIPAGGRMLWAFLNSNLVAQTVGYTLMMIMLRQSLNKTPQRTCPNPCPSKINVKFDHKEISDIVSSAVRSALAEATGVNEGSAQ